MKKLTLISFFLLLYCSPLLAQQPTITDQVKDARFRIVKTTVVFLATDHKTFGNKPQIDSGYLACANYEMLKKFALDNKLSKVPELINEWKKLPLDTFAGSWKASLDKFRENVQAKISGGEKSFRQDLAGYPAYVQNLEGILSSVDNDALATAPPKEPLPEKPAPASAMQTSPEKTGIAGFFRVYGEHVGILLLACWVAALYLLSKKKSRRARARSKKDLEEAEITIREGNLREILLKNKLDEVMAHAAAMEVALNKERSRSRQPEAQPVVQAVTALVPEKKESPLRYARYADQGDGFSAADLLKEEDSETIFELRLTSGNTAVFSISGNAAAQRYALSNTAYFLGKTCIYGSQLSGQHTIHTDAPGELKLQGDKWRILHPARISFR